VPVHVAGGGHCILIVTFHYAIWFETGSKLVADRFDAGRGPASSCHFAVSKLDDRPNFSSLQVCDQLRTSLEPDSVMEFGLNQPFVFRNSKYHNIHYFCVLCCLL